MDAIDLAPRGIEPAEMLFQRSDHQTQTGFRRHEARAVVLQDLVGRQQRQRRLTIGLVGTEIPASQDALRRLDVGVLAIDREQIVDQCDHL